MIEGTDELLCQHFDWLHKKVSELEERNSKLFDENTRLTLELIKEREINRSNITLPQLPDFNNDWNPNVKQIWIKSYEKLVEYLYK